MKKVLLLILLAVGTTKIYSQEESTYTDEELTKYASVMAWAEMEKDRMTEIYNDWINNNTTLEAARFVEIKNTKGDSLKMVEIAVEANELTAFEMIQSNYDSMTSSFKEVYVGKIKEDIGAGLYNKLKKSLKVDTDVKARYEDIYDSQIAKQKEAKEEETED